MYLCHKKTLRIVKENSHNIIFVQLCWSKAVKPIVRFYSKIGWKRMISHPSSSGFHDPSEDKINEEHHKWFHVLTLKTQEIRPYFYCFFRLTLKYPNSLEQQHNLLPRLLIMVVDWYDPFPGYQNCHISLVSKSSLWRSLVLSVRNQKSWILTSNSHEPLWCHHSAIPQFICIHWW